jgi:hypothetical protein
MMFNPFLLQNTVQGFLTGPYGAWFPIVMITAVVVIMIVALIYMICAMIGRENMRAWAKLKIYDVLLSLILVFAFLGICGFVFSAINFPQVFKDAHLAPSSCTGSSQGTDLFSLALCNMRQFNQNILQLNNMLYMMALRFSFVPKITFDASVLIPIEGIGPSVSIEPPSALDTLIGYGLQLLYGAYVISEVQLLLLGAALMLFSVFMGIGLIARMFEVTKSFGGAMIAFGIGLGILYPLMVSFTYGYINVNMAANSIAIDFTQWATIIGGMFAVLLFFIFSAAAPAGFAPWMMSFVTFIGLAFAGLTIIPVINFMIVDVFISDFSKAVGEKMSFLSLLTKII